MKLKKIFSSFLLTGVLTLASITFTHAASNTIGIEKEIEQMYEVLLNYNNKLKLRTNQESHMNLIARRDNSITVGMLDINNEELKKEILSIPELNSELIEFAEFIPLDFRRPTSPKESEDSILPRASYNIGSIINRLLAKLTP
jgi:hypothetical protein